MRHRKLALATGWLALSAAAACAISFSPFGPHGEGGSRNGQDFRIGAGGSVYELDAFLFVAGLDLNGPELGTTAQLSRHSLPSGLDFTFTSSLSVDRTDLILTYTFFNNSTNAFNDMRFFALLDAEIDQAQNTFFNEYGESSGVPGVGAGDLDPDYWEIGEPGFAGGSLLQNLFRGTLANANAIPRQSPNDVALALGFSLGNLSTQALASVRITISEDSQFEGSYYLIQRDLALDSPTTITLSGAASTNSLPPQPTFIEFGAQWRLNRSRGSLIGTFYFTNLAAAASASVSQPFELLLHTNSNFRYVQPDGTENGVPFLDLTSLVMPQLGVEGLFGPSETVVVDGIEIFSRDRSPPPPSPINPLFEFWAAPAR